MADRNRHALRTGALPCALCVCQSRVTEFSLHDMNTARNPKKFSRGKIVAIAGVFLIAGVWIYRAFNSVSSNRDIALFFAGFTNYDRGPYVGEPDRYQGLHAWFWVTNGSQPATWAVTSFSQKIGERWWELPLTNTWIHETIPESDSFAHLDSPHMIKLISFSVSETNLPIRIVITSTERATGFRGIMDVLHQFDADHIHKLSYIIVNGRHYSVTNEFYERK